MLHCRHTKVRSHGCQRRRQLRSTAAQSYGLLKIKANQSHGCQLRRQLRSTAARSYGLLKIKANQDQVPKPMGDSFNGPTLTSSRGLYKNFSCSGTGPEVRDGVRKGLEKIAWSCMSENDQKLAMTPMRRSQQAPERGSSKIVLAIGRISVHY